MVPVAYTKKEIQKILRIGEGTFYRLVQLRKLESFRVGAGRGDYRVTEQQLLKYIRESTVK